jgi:hypothetical protein
MTQKQPNRTMQSESFKDAIHLSRIIPLGKKTPEKKAAVSKLMTGIKRFLAENH